ncbi:hypothetical protein INR49_014880 [Caranx melampygus]|nr:hypothetical protein INR49_014880 [Caranx melampygus]
MLLGSSSTFSTLLTKRDSPRSDSRTLMKVMPRPGSRCSGAISPASWFVRLSRTRGRWGGVTSYQPPRSDWLPILTRHSCDCFLQRKLLSLV